MLRSAWLRRAGVTVLIAGSAVGAVAMGATPQAMAASCSSTSGAAGCTVGGAATVTGGSLTVEAPATLSWSDTLSGVDQSVDAPATVEPIDATGSGTGWAVTVASTTFASTSPAASLPTTALSVNGSDVSSSSTSAPAASCDTDSTCALPTSTSDPVVYPLDVPAAATAPTPVNLYTADASTGMGSIDLAANWWLSIPASALAASYSNTISLAIVSGP